MQTIRELPKYPPAAIVRFFNALRRRLSCISNRFTHPNVLMLEKIQNLWLLGSVSVACQLGIADILKDGPKNIRELATLTGSVEDVLYRIMRLLASEGIFKESGDRVFSNSSLSESMKETELRYFIEHTLNSMQFRIFGDLMHSVKTGRRSSELFMEGEVFDFMGASEQRNELYNKAMTNTSRMQIAAIFSAFDFSRYSHVVDIGSGRGFFLTALLEKNPHMKGTLFDLPQVLEDKKTLSVNSTMDDRLTVIPGSFFDTIPEGGDLYTLKNILHGWDDARAEKILNNIRNSVKCETRIMIIEAVVGETNKQSWAKASDIFMLAGVGGRERTEEEFRTLLQRAGFKIERVVDTVSPLSLIIAVPDLNN